MTMFRCGKHLLYCLVLHYIISNFNNFVFLNSQGSAAMQLKCAGKYYLYFVGNFMHFPAVKTL